MRTTQQTASRKEQPSEQHAGLWLVYLLQWSVLPISAFVCLIKRVFCNDISQNGKAASKLALRNKSALKPSVYFDLSNARLRLADLCPRQLNVLVQEPLKWFMTCIIKHVG
jgi:hypothetical protein